MTRDGMPRAYLRLDPNIDQTHPDLNGFVRLMCAAARQTERGRFRDQAQLEALFGKAKARAMLTREDVVPLADGRLYVEGWDEWQEGDHTVADRMKRMRARRAAKRNRTVSAVTPSPSPDRTDVTTDAVAKGLAGTPVGDGGDFSPPPAKLGRRKNGTNPRAQGTNPRANGTSPRQEREERKKGGLESIHAILEGARKTRPADA
jgi:hypothetical protein